MLYVVAVVRGVTTSDMRGDAAVRTPADRIARAAVSNDGSAVAGRAGARGGAFPPQPLLSAVSIVSSCGRRWRLVLISSSRWIRSVSRPAAPSKAAPAATGVAAAEPSMSWPKTTSSTVARMFGFAVRARVVPAAPRCTAAFFSEVGTPAAPAYSGSSVSGVTVSEPSMSRPKTTASTSERIAGASSFVPRAWFASKASMNSVLGAPATPSAASPPPAASDPSMSCPKTTRSTFESVHSRPIPARPLCANSGWSPDSTTRPAAPSKAAPSVRTATSKEPSVSWPKMTSSTVARRCGAPVRFLPCSPIIDVFAWRDAAAIFCESEPAASAKAACSCSRAGFVSVSMP